METKQTYKSALLNESVPKEIDRYLDYSMTITKIIIDKLRGDKITKREFARSLGKNESQISEWLSGRHNFTLRTLADMSAMYELDFSEAFKLVIDPQQNESVFTSVNKLLPSLLDESNKLLSSSVFEEVFKNINIGKYFSEFDQSIAGTNRTENEFGHNPVGGTRESPSNEVKNNNQSKTNLTLIAA